MAPVVKATMMATKGVPWKKNFKSQKEWNVGSGFADSNFDRLFVEVGVIGFDEVNALLVIDALLVVEVTLRRNENSNMNYFHTFPVSSQLLAATTTTFPAFFFLPYTRSR